jgi:predicted N-acetyltransferase YhbS
MATGTEAIVRLRAMTPDDLAAAHALSRAEQWPHRLEDWAICLKLGAGVVACREDEVIGTAMYWAYGTEFATIGMVIVSRAEQGHGLGRLLMQNVIDQLGDRTLLLNSTNEGRRLYERLGFIAIGSVFQHQGAAFAVPMASLIPNERVAPMKAGDLVAVAELDALAVGMNRSHVIQHLCGISQGIMLNREDDPAGFALYRRFGRGYSLAPVIAPDVGGAKLLISQWLGTNVGMFCRLDVREDSQLSTWLDDLGLPCVGRVTRMVRGPAPVTGKGVFAYSLINQAMG